MVWVLTVLFCVCVYYYYYYYYYYCYYYGCKNNYVCVLFDLVWVFCLFSELKSS